ncbi:MAG: VacJ family lipoprotein [Burkholderiaceae bacterium]
MPPDWKNPLATVGRSLPLLFMLALGTGCATVTSPDVRDPLESINRNIYVFNNAVDKALVRPAAIVYRDVVPAPVRYGVSNFLGNLEDVWSIVNNSLQGKGQAAGRSVARVIVNTVFGLGGVLDVASELRIPRRDADFSQTLGVWGVPDGPYLMLPLLGPSIARDLLAWPVDSQGYLVGQVSDIPVRNSLLVLDQLDTRVDLLSAEKTLDESALDRYSFIRDIFFQRRRSAVFDGDPPPEVMETKPKSP